MQRDGARLRLRRFRTLMTAAHSAASIRTTFGVLLKILVIPIFSLSSTKKNSDDGIRQDHQEARVREVILVEETEEIELTIPDSGRT